MKPEQLPLPLARVPQRRKSKGWTPGFYVEQGGKVVWFVATDSVFAVNKKGDILKYPNRARAARAANLLNNPVKGATP